MIDGQDDWHPAPAWVYWVFIACAALCGIGVAVAIAMWRA